MVLQLLEEDGSWVDSILQYFDLYTHPSLQRSHDIFSSHPIYEVSSEDSLVCYISQSELGINLPIQESQDGYYNIIGSDDATTCHIILVSYFLNNNDISHDPAVQEDMNDKDKKWMIAHLDSIRKVQEFSTFLYNIPVDTFDVYIMGGMMIDQSTENLSHQLSQEIFNILHNSREKYFHLHLFFTCELNTTISEVTTSTNRQLYYPKFYGCGYHKKSNSVIPMHFPLSYRQPDYFLRSLALWLNHSATIETSTPLLLRHEGLSLHIDYSYLFYNISPDLWNFFSTLADLPNNEQSNQLILRYTSTSPHCEPSHFLPSIRDTLRYIKENYTPQGKSLYTGPRQITYIPPINHEIKQVEWRIMDSFSSLSSSAIHLEMNEDSTSENS